MPLEYDADAVDHVLARITAAAKPAAMNWADIGMSITRGRALSGTKYTPRGSTNWSIHLCLVFAKGDAVNLYASADSLPAVEASMMIYIQSEHDRRPKQAA